MSGTERVRAYCEDLNSDLLGFDHERRGYRMLSDWEAPASKEDVA